MPGLDELAIREGVRDTLLRYTHGVDQRSWDLYLEAFTPDAVVRVPGFLAEEFSATEFAQVLSGSFDDVRLSGQHHLGGTLWNRTGEDTVRAVTPFLAVGSERSGDSVVEVQRSAGVYVDELVRQKGRWLIRRRDLLQTTDDRYLFPVDAEDLAATAGAADNPVADQFRTPSKEGHPVTDQTDPQLLRALLDRAQIQDTLSAYAQSQDQNAWDLYDRVFTDDAVIELPGTGIDPLGAADLKAFLRDGFNSTHVAGQHLIGNVLIDVHGDTARSVAELLSVTLQTTEQPGRLSRIQASGLYIDTWTRTGDGWRIAHRVSTQKHLQRDEVDYAQELLDTVSAHGTIADVPTGLA